MCVCVMYEHYLVLHKYITLLCVSKIKLKRIKGLVNFEKVDIVPWSCQVTNNYFSLLYSKIISIELNPILYSIFFLNILLTVLISINNMSGYVN